MVSTKQNSDWDNSGSPRSVSRMHRKPIAVYDFTRREGNRFFYYLGKFTFLCLIGLSVYMTAVWSLLHRQPSRISGVSTDSDGSPPFWTDLAFSSPVVVQAAASQSPKLNYVVSWGITSSSASISWSTDVPSTTALAYGTTSSLGQLVPSETKLEINHGVKLTGLKSGATYYFVAQSADKNGVIGYSTTYTFKTLAAASSPTISGIVVSPGKNNQVQISWTTSVPAYSFVQIGSTTSYNRWSTRTGLTTNPHPSIAWVPSGIVHYQLVSTDAYGNKTVSPDYTFIEP